MKKQQENGRKWHQTILSTIQKRKSDQFSIIDFVFQNFNFLELREELIRLEYKLQIEKDKADREESIRLNLIRLEQERKERGEREEKERLEKLEKQEKERKERLEKQEKERLEKLELERLRREEQEKIDKVRQEYEREQQAFERAFKMQMDNFIESGGASIENSNFLFPYRSEYNLLTLLQSRQLKLIQRLKTFRLMMIMLIY